MIRKILFALATVYCVQAAGPASAKVIIKERTEYYRVSGKTGAQVYQQMLRKGPRIGRTKDHYIATATISFSINNIDSYEWRNQCVIRNLDVVLNVVYRIPKWDRPKATSRQLAGAWDTFLAHIWRHERQHTNIAKETAYELWRAIKGVKGTSSRKCNDMLGPAKRRASQIYVRYDQKQARFDASAFGDGGQQFKHDERLQAAE